MALQQTIAIEQLLSRMAEQGASDLHLTVGIPPTLRLHGVLTPLADEQVVTPELIQGVLTQLLSEAQRGVLEQERSIVTTYTQNEKARYKLNVYYQKGYPSVSLRYVSPRILTVRELGLPPVLEQFATLRQGIVVVCGPFGSGRSATLAALLDLINATRAEHILTLERPIEYLFVNQKSVVEQREVGTDARSFEEAIANSFQEDVNVVMLSELTSAGMIEGALSLAQSGRLVFTSVNTDSVVQTLEYLITSAPESQQEQIRLQLSETLQGIVAQRLLPKSGGGSVAVAEILMVTPAIRTLLRDGSIFQVQTMMQTSRDEGMMPLDRALAEQVKAGTMSLEDASLQASDPTALKALLRSSYPA